MATPELNFKYKAANDIGFVNNEFECNGDANLEEVARQRVIMRCEQHNFKPTEAEIKMMAKTLLLSAQSVRCFLAQIEETTTAMSNHYSVKLGER